VLALDGEDVGVPRHRPERLEAVLGDAVDGILASQRRGGPVPGGEIRIGLRIDEDAAEIAQSVSASRARW
jgi:hypothetical protein